MSVTSRCWSIGLSVNFFFVCEFLSVSCLSVSCLSVRGRVTIETVQLGMYMTVPSDKNLACWITVC